MTERSKVLWTEKYRPTDLEEVALSEGNRALLLSCIEGGEIPHLLFHGPAGCGKTTVAKILMDALDCTQLVLNASAERGIDTIRDKVGSFVRVQTGAAWNVVFLDEADKLTPDAQTALRNMMETYAERSRFILTGNYLSKILDPIQSRCQVVELGAMPLKERFRVLVEVLKVEEVEFDKEVVFAYAERYTDMRRLLLRAQRSIMSHGKLTDPKVATGEGAQILQLIRNKDWLALVQLSKHPEFDHQQGLVDLFWAIPDDLSTDSHPAAAAQWRAAVAKAVHQSGHTPEIGRASCRERVYTQV